MKRASLLSRSVIVVNRILKWLRGRVPGVADNLFASLVIALLGMLLFYFRNRIIPILTQGVRQFQTFLNTKQIFPIWAQVVFACFLVLSIVSMVVVVVLKRRRQPWRALDFQPDADFEAFVDEIRRTMKIQGMEITEPTPSGLDVLGVETSGSTLKHVAVACEPYLGFDMTKVRTRSLVRILSKNSIARGYYVCRAVHSVPSVIQCRDSTLHLTTYRDFVLGGLNFDHYLTSLIHEWESSETSKEYIDMAGRDEQGRLFRPLDELIDRLLREPERGNCIALLGDFGSGKTTFLRRYSSVLARRHLENPFLHRIPVLVNLRDCEFDEPIDVFVSSQLRRSGVGRDQDHIYNSQIAPKIILILDALDEMSLKADRVSTQRNLKRIQQAACRSHGGLVLSCRTHFFRDSVEEHQLQGFFSIHLEPWGTTELVEYLQKSIGSEWQQALRTIRGTYNLQELSQTPLFLNMTVESLDSLADRDIDSADLYELYTRRWIDAQIYKASLDRDQKAEFMEELGWRMLTEGRLSIPWPDLRDFIQSRYRLSITEVGRFDNDIRTCSFLRRTNGSYSFVHRSFFEFFAARYLSKHVKANAIDALCQVEVSHEIATFMAELLDDFVCYERLHMWLEFSVEPRYALARRNAANVLRTMSRMPFPSTRAELRTQRIKECADIAISGHDTASRWKAITALGWLRSAESPAILRHLLAGTETDVRILRIVALVLGLLGDSESVSSIVQLLKRGENWTVRQNAAVALGLMGDSSAIPSLIACLEQEEEYQVRRSAVWAIESIDPMVARTALTDRALHDESEEVRQYATLALGSLEGVAALGILEQILLDKNPVVRKSALQAICKIGGLEALRLAESCQNDPDQEVREASRYAANMLKSQK